MFSIYDKAATIGLLLIFDHYYRRAITVILKDPDELLVYIYSRDYTTNLNENEDGNEKWIT